MNALPSTTTVRLERRGAVLFVSIDRPQTRNALSQAVREDLESARVWLAQSAEVRAVVLRGAGGHFCGGGDLNDFKRNFESNPPGAGERDVIASDNRRFGDLLLALRSLPQVVISLVEGDAFGGALGLISVSDIALGVQTARFSISETSLGVIPAQIAPFVVQRIGLSHTLRLALTGIRFDAAEAQAIGLIHRCCASTEEAEEQLGLAITGVLRCGPKANAATKQLLLRSASCVAADVPSLLDWASDRFAERLRSPEGHEGVRAFLEKRRPAWVSHNE